MSNAIEPILSYRRNLLKGLESVAADLAEAEKVVSHLRGKSDQIRSEIRSTETVLRNVFGWSPAGSQPESLPTPSGDPTFFDPPEVPDRIPYVEEAMNWVQGASGRVTVNDYKAHLISRYDKSFINKGSLRTPLKRLVQLGTLKVVKSGFGKHPTLYEIVKKTDE